MNTKLARDIMRPKNVALRRKMTLDRVSDHLSMHGLSGAPVVNVNGEPIGYVSEYDCLQQLMQASYYSDNSALVEDVMITTLITTRPDIAVIDLAAEMNDKKVNVMPIVENGLLLGAVSRGDVMRSLVQDMDLHQVPV